MAAIRKFHFDISFDADQDRREEAAPAAPPEPRFSAAELAAAREHAFAEGRAAALAEARAAADHACAEALARLADQTGRLFAAQQEADERNARGAVATAVALVRRLFPELARRGGLVEVEGVLARCLETMHAEPRVVVRLHDSLLDPLRERLEPVTAAAGYDGRIVLLADPGLAVGDCRVEWADGGIERDSERLWREVEAALARHAPTPPQPAPG